MLSDSVSNLTVESILDYSAEEMTTNFNGDSFDSSNENLEYYSSNHGDANNDNYNNGRLHANIDSDSSTSDNNGEYMQIICDYSDTNLKSWYFIILLLLLINYSN